MKFFLSKNIFNLVAVTQQNANMYANILISSVVFVFYELIN